MIVDATPSMPTAAGSAPGSPRGGTPPPSAPAPGIWWTDADVSSRGLPSEDVPFVSVGGGMGSFAMVDYLRVVGGLGVDDIRVVSTLTRPWDTYEHLTRCSQIPRGERIRSDAASRPDNLWGFPSYAVQEAWRRRSLRPLLHVGVEPLLTGYYTPRLDDVLRGIEKEAHRIRYWDMLVPGVAVLVRRRVGGGYFVLISSRADRTPERVLRCRDVHLAVGYAGLSFQPEIQRFRTEHQDHTAVVNAYEDHEHVYARLRRSGGTVIVRGGGIVASRVLERLCQERERDGADFEVLHLLRTYVEGPHGPHAWARRPGSHGFAYQGFNYPKSAWGGQLKARMARADDEGRRELYDLIGGTTTARRPSWQRQLRRARDAGWYRATAGVLQDLRPQEGRLVARIAGTSSTSDVTVDAVIDCTGLDGDVRRHRILADLLDHGGASTNPLGRVDVSPCFEVRGTRSDMGRVYLSGAAALGGYFPGVDTFLGLQIAAQEIVDDLAGRGLCRRLSPTGSMRQWMRWARNKSV